MAVRRTKRQKQKAEEKRSESIQYSLSDLGNAKNIDTTVKKSKSSKQTKQDRQKNKYVKKDLFRTLVVTLVVVSVLIAYTIYYR